MATEADIHRSTPGYVYGVGMRTSRQEEGTPSCPCPCHLANRPLGAQGPYCDVCYGWTMTCSSVYVEPVPYSHEQAIADGTANPRRYMVNVPDYYFITKGNTLEDAFPRRHFKTPEAAEKAADKLNEQDVLESLNLTPTAIIRRDRLKKLGETFWVRYGDGHPETRWPEEPGRYAVQSWSERYSESSWDTFETLDEVRNEIADGGVERVVDLDTGLDVRYAVKVEIL